MSDAKGLDPGGMGRGQKDTGQRQGLEFKAFAPPAGAGQTICLVIDMSRTRNVEESGGRER